MRLIIVDGLDGCGKDTQADLIRRKYEKKGEKVIVRSHPESDNFFGRRTKKALLGEGKLNKIRASIYYMLDVLRSIRIYYRPKDVDTLIMVRYLVGTAYLPTRLAIIGYKFFSGFVPMSDYMFFLDSPPEELIKRMEGREQKEMFETIALLRKVRKKALMLVKDYIVIDASRTINQTHKNIDKKLTILDKN